MRTHVHGECGQNARVAHLGLVQVADEGERGGPRDAELLEVLVGMVDKAATAECNKQCNEERAD